MPVFYIITATYTYLGVFYFNFAKVVPANLYELTSNRYILEASNVFLIFVFFYLLGCLFSHVFFNKGLVASNNQNLLNSIAVFKDRVPQSLMIFIALSAPILLLLSFGTEEVFSRTGYTSDSRVMIGMTLSRILLPISCICIAFVKGNIFRYSLLFINYIMLFGITSRAMVFVPFFYLLGCFLISEKFGFKRTIICIFVSVFSLALSLDYRFNLQQGILPNVESIFRDGVDFSIVVYGLNYTLSYSVILLGYMIQTVDYDLSLFFAALSPLPSFIYDISNIISDAKVRANIPYSAIGELYLSGYFLFLVISFGLGCFLNKSEMYFKKKSGIFVFIAFVFMAMFALMSTQYQLRGAFRLIYYIFFIMLFLSTKRALSSITFYR
ncbi:oligosaccharide repeat unit polymerase [Pseudoalteromonas aurantia]|uniref:oligosaccharide repeat unit polymerase n=1 Tax=Pseudoalteromonas aurantia TaxID=43654 RepID=UPI00110A43A0|nr:oligosaccharide repeat unit polymerase [Pseudoalteromonas aurantia]